MGFEQAARGNHRHGRIDAYLTKRWQQAQQPRAECLGAVARIAVNESREKISITEKPIPDIARAIFQRFY